MKILRRMIVHKSRALVSFLLLVIASQTLLLLLFGVVQYFATPLAPLPVSGSPQKRDFLRNSPVNTSSHSAQTREESRILDFLNGSITTGCPKTRRPLPAQVRYRHQQWQVHRDDYDEIVVYSAFYDDRPMVGYLPWIRILGVRLLLGQPEPPLFCYVWYSRFDAPFVTEVTVNVTGRDHGIKGNRKYGQRLFSCALSVAFPFPTHVSIATMKCDASTILLPVFRGVRAAEWQHEFGVCVESSFGSFPPEVISEWIESYSLFGVTQFNIYNASLDSTLDRLFDYYTRKGIVTLRQLPPSVDDFSEEGIRLSSPTSLNDCMMRNMYSDRFVIIVDYDEIIVPRNHSSYSALVADLDASLGLAESHHSYAFRNSYFFLFFPQDENQSESLRTQRFRHRSTPDEFLFAPKSFVDPRKCFSVFNHYCYLNFPGIGNEDPIDVPVSLGLSHHYRRQCSLSVNECRSYDENKMRDDTMLRFKKVLENRVSAALGEIYKERR